MTLIRNLSSGRFIAPITSSFRTSNSLVISRSSALNGVRSAHSNVKVAKSSNPETGLKTEKLSHEEIEHLASEWPTEIGARSFTMRRFGIVEPPHGEEKVYSGEETLNEKENVGNGFLLKTIAVVAGIFAIVQLDQLLYPVRYDHPLNKLYRDYKAGNTSEGLYKYLGEEFNRQRRLSDDNLILLDQRELTPRARLYNKHHLIESPIHGDPANNVDMTEVEKKIDEFNNSDSKTLSEARSTGQLLQLPKRHFS